MIGSLLSFLGIPTCARSGCGKPGIIRFELSDQHGPAWIDLCPFCVVSVKEALAEVSTVMEERREILGTEAPEGRELPPPTGA